MAPGNLTPLASEGTLPPHRHITTGNKECIKNDCWQARWHTSPVVAALESGVGDELSPIASQPGRQRENRSATGGNGTVIASASPVSERPPNHLNYVVLAVLELIM